MGGVIRAGLPALCPRTPDVERCPEHGHNNTANNRGGSGQRRFERRHEACAGRAAGARALFWRELIRRRRTLALLRSLSPGYRWAIRIVIVVLAIEAGFVLLLIGRPWPSDVTLKHFLAMRGCD